MKDKFRLTYTKKNLFSITIIALSFIFLFLPFNNLVINGIYNWHVQQPEVIEGFFELLIIFGAMLISVKYVSNRNYQLVILSAISLLYLSLHQVIFPALTALIYIEIILLIGTATRKLVLKKQMHELTISSYLENLVFGTLIWAAFTIIISMLGYGLFWHVRILTIILAAISILILQKHKPITFLLIKKFSFQKKSNKLLILIILLIFLASFARSNRAIDHDSMLYGLRPEYALVGPNSFYDNLGYVNSIHYFPKLFEVFLLPISDLGDYSFIFNVNTVLLSFLTLLFYSILKSQKVTTSEALFSSIVLITIPAVLHMATSAKPDIFAALFFLISCYYFYRTTKKFSVEYFIVAVSALSISLSSKYIVWGYIPFLIISTLSSGFYFYKKNHLNSSQVITYLKKDRTNLIRSLVIILISVFVVFGVFLRNYLINGQPLRLFQEVQTSLGFELKYPFDNFNLATENYLLYFYENFREIPHYLFQIFFNPSDLTHMIFTWMGNIYIFLILVLIVAKLLKVKFVRRENSLILFFVPILVGGIHYLLSFSVPHTIGAIGGDGNYFLIPIVSALIILFSLLVRIDKAYKNLLFICITFFIAVQGLISLISHPSWKPGISETNLNPFKSNIETPVSNEIIFNKTGIGEINRYVSQTPRTTRCLSIEAPYREIYRLNCSLEAVEHIEVFIGNPSILETNKSFVKYLEWANITYLIYPVEYEDMPILKTFEESPGAVVVVDKKFKVLNLSGIENLEQKYSDDLPLFVQK